MTVYFALSRGRNLVKIGFTLFVGRLPDRINSLLREERRLFGPSSYVVVLGVWPAANKDDEASLHSYWFDCHSVGEWFVPSAALLEYARQAHPFEIEALRRFRPDRCDDWHAEEVGTPLSVRAPRAALSRGGRPKRAAAFP